MGLKEPGESNILEPCPVAVVGIKSGHWQGCSERGSRGLVPLLSSHAADASHYQTLLEAREQMHTTGIFFGWRSASQGMKLVWAWIWGGAEAGAGSQKKNLF